MPEQSSLASPRAGLVTRTGPVPLEGVRVDARVKDIFAHVTITQRYRNLEPQPIEVVYVFPLDERAAVCGFEAIVAGTHFVGQVKERDEAFRSYDEALAAGHGAYLLDEERPDVFSASLGNVPPGAEVLLRITYVAELGFEGDAVRFVLPTTVSPRYAPAEDQRGVGRPDAEALNPPVDWRVPYGLDLSVGFEMGGPIRHVESPSHPISVRIEGSTAAVTLAQQDAPLDRDVVILATAAGVGAPHVVLERDDRGRSAAAVVFRPEFPVEQAPSELVFLVDRSGSMEGSSIAEVRNALQLALRSLVPGCRFNIVGFGSTFESLFPESREYDEGSLGVASRHVAGLAADLGGTEILPALEFVLTRPRAELPRQVVILTDGEVTNTDAVIALAGRHAGDARVFTFGIGRGASHHLVRGLARAGGGSSEFIYPGERVEPKVMRQLSRLLSPALTDVKVDWGGLSVTPAPTVVPPIFAGDRVLVYALVGQLLPTQVTLSAKGPSGPLFFTLSIDADRVRPGRTVATLAARARIRELEESPEWLPSRGSKQARRTASRVTDEIIQLGTTYGLASRETSFVAIEYRDTPVEDESVLRRVPIALTSGWGGIADRCVATTVFDGAFPSTSKLLGSLEDVQRLERRPVRAAARAVRHETVAGDGVFESLLPAAPAHRLGFFRMAMLQRADGSWELDEELASVVGISLAHLTTVASAASGPGDEARRALATALVIAWLSRAFDDRRDEWGPLARKARRWLDAVTARPAGVRPGAHPTSAAAWLDLAETLLPL